MIVNEASTDSLNFKQLGFEIEKTKDGSPTLRLIDGDERGGESMHHSGGALSETGLIYGQALDWGFKNHANPVVVSLGLGLGYVEILTCAKSLLHNSSQAQILSFEIVKGLRENFRNFFIDGKKSETYEWILENIAATEKVNVEDLRDKTKKSLEENQIQLLGNFIPWASNLETFDVFCYDAFSKKTSPELWAEEFMKNIFLKGSAKSCVSSYASNGVLKRALAAAGYNLEKLAGFQGKRNRTWAYRL